VSSPPKSGNGFKPLSEYYTTPEVAKAFDSFNEVSKSINGLYRKYMVAVTRVKLAKTAYSIKGIVRNFLSNPVNFLANGNYNFTGAMSEMNDVFIGKDFKTKSRNLLAYLAEHGIIQDNIDAGAIRANLKQLDKLNNGLNKYRQNPIGGIISKIDKTMLTAYEFGDDFWKTLRFFSEKSRYKDVYLKQGKGKELADEMAEDKATEILHDTTAYYSQQPKFLQALRYFPATGTFVSFPYLTMRNAFHTIKLATKEMQSADTFHIGMQRMSGMAIAVSALSLLAMGLNKGTGKDENDMEDLRRFLPAFWKNDIVAVTKDLQDGKYRYFNFSYMDYYNSVTTPTLMLTRKAIANGEITEEDTWEAIQTFFEPYVSEDILFKKLISLKRNWDNDREKTVYTKGDFIERPGIFIADVWNYMWEAFNPATISDLWKIYSSYKEGGDWKGQLSGMAMGNQVRTLDVEKSLRFYNFPKCKSVIEEARSEFYKEKTSKEKTGENTESIIAMTEDRINRSIDRAKEDVLAAQRQGVSRKVIYEALKKTRMDRDIQWAILNDQYIQLDKDGGILPKRKTKEE
jgi:hypothetical protein